MIYVYTDGACSGERRRMGIGVVLVVDEWLWELRQYVGSDGTGNRAEVIAIQKALQHLRTLGRDRDLIELYTDSQFATDSLTASDNKTGPDKRLVNETRRLARKFTKLKIVKVPGHSGIPGNELADRLAKAAARKNSLGRGLLRTRHDQSMFAPEDQIGGWLDVGARAREKQAARDRDAEMVDRGEITREELNERNGFISGNGARVVVGQTDIQDNSE